MLAGVPAQQIEIKSEGELNPAIPTPDNTKEPKNRWVEVAVQGPPIEYRPQFPSATAHEPGGDKPKPSTKAKDAKPEATKDSDEDKGPVEVKGRSWLSRLLASSEYR